MNAHCLGWVQITTVPLDNVAVAIAITKVASNVDISTSNVLFTTDSNAKLELACVKVGEIESLASRTICIYWFDETAWHLI